MMARSGGARSADDARSAAPHDLVARPVRPLFLVGKGQHRFDPSLGEDRRRDRKRRNAASVVEMTGPIPVGARSALRDRHDSVAPLKAGSWVGADEEWNAILRYDLALGGDDITPLSQVEAIGARGAAAVLGQVIAERRQRISGTVERLDEIADRVEMGEIPQRLVLRPRSGQHHRARGVVEIGVEPQISDRRRRRCEEDRGAPARASRSQPSTARAYPRSRRDTARPVRA